MNQSGDGGYVLSLQAPSEVVEGVVQLGVESSESRATGVDVATKGLAETVIHADVHVVAEQTREIVAYVETSASRAILSWLESEDADVRLQGYDWILTLLLADETQNTDGADLTDQFCAVMLRALHDESLEVRKWAVIECGLRISELRSELTIDSVFEAQLSESAGGALRDRIEELIEESIGATDPDEASYLFGHMAALAYRGRAANRFTLWAALHETRPLQVRPDVACALLSCPSAIDIVGLGDAAAPDDYQVSEIRNAIVWLVRHTEYGEARKVLSAVAERPLIESAPDLVRALHKAARDRKRIWSGNLPSVTGAWLKQVQAAEKEKERAVKSAKAESTAKP